MVDHPPAEWRQLYGLGTATAFLDPLPDQHLADCSHPAQLGVSHDSLGGGRGAYLCQDLLTRLGIAVVALVSGGT